MTSLPESIGDLPIQRGPTTDQMNVVREIQGCIRVRSIGAVC